MRDADFDARATSSRARASANTHAAIAGTTLSLVDDTPHIHDIQEAFRPAITNRSRKRTAKAFEDDDDDEDDNDEVYFPVHRQNLRPLAARIAPSSATHINELLVDHRPLTFGNFPRMPKAAAIRSTGISTSAPPLNTTAYESTSAFTPPGQFKPSTNNPAPEFHIPRGYIATIGTLTPDGFSTPRLVTVVERSDPQGKHACGATNLLSRSANALRQDLAQNDQGGAARPSGAPAVRGRARGVPSYPARQRPQAGVCQLQLEEHLVLARPAVHAVRRQPLRGAVFLQAQGPGTQGVSPEEEVVCISRVMQSALM